MSVSPVSAEQFYGTKAAAPKSTLDMNAFLNLLSVQMANQNPLEPMNDRDYFAQLAQLGQVQGIDKLTNQSELEQIQNMMGKEITAVRTVSETGGTEDTVTGIATKLSIRNGERYLSIREADGGEAEVKLSNVQSVRDRAHAADYASMVGKTVQGTSITGALLNGKVTGIGESATGVVLTIEGSGVTMPIENLVSIAG